MTLCEFCARELGSARCTVALQDGHKVHLCSAQCAFEEGCQRAREEAGARVSQL